MMALYNFGLRIPRILVATSLAAFGVEHFLFGDFITGRAPAYPAGVPGQLILAYCTGALWLACAIGLVLEKKIQWLLAGCGIIILVWAAGRNILLLIMHPEYGGLLTNTFKGLTLGFGAFIIAATLPSTGQPDFLLKFSRLMAITGPYIVGLFLLIAGIQHFIFADFVNFIVPAWLPFVPFWTYFSGLALIAAGLGIITGIKKYWAAWLSACMILVWVIVLHLPRAFMNQNQNEWIAVFEALAVGGILLLISKDKSTG